MKAIDHLKEVYSGFDQKWIEKNRFVLETAVPHGMAIGGSIALALGTKKAKKDPSDIDFVCPSVNDAVAFIAALQVKLLQYKSHWRVYANHNTEFVPPGCITHFRFQTAFWLPICIMVIPVEKFRFWFSHGLRVQLFDLAKKAASDLELVDEKDRTSLYENPAEESLEHEGKEYSEELVIGIEAPEEIDLNHDPNWSEALQSQGAGPTYFTTKP
jgi:hypothetical protein